MQVECNLKICWVKKHNYPTFAGQQEFIQHLQKNFKHQILSQIYPFVSTLSLMEFKGIVNEEKPPWNKIEPSIFFDEAKCGPLHMLYCIVMFG